MIIGINTITSSITINKASLKKTTDFVRVFNFDYSLLPFENKIKAIHEVLATDAIDLLNTTKTRTLLLPDELVFSDTMELPPLPKGKVKDVFETRFKLLYPQSGDLYMTYREIERSKKRIVVQFTIANVSKIRKLIDTFFEQGIIINFIDFYSHHFITQYAKVSDSPKAYLFVGNHNSELIIYKKNVEVLSQSIKFGEQELFDTTNFFESAYNLENREAKRYASYIKKNFASSVQATDEEIFMTEIGEEYYPTEPREIRVLKDQALESYIIRHNFRLLHGLVSDCIEFCSKSSWPVNVSNVTVISSDNVYITLNEASEEDDMYIKADYSLNDILSRPVAANLLFSNNNIAKEKKRRKINWSKFFSINIGKKKKD